MYESKNKPLVTRAVFTRRMLLHVLIAIAIIVVTLAIGVAGHIYFDDMNFSAALVASTTLTSGLGLSYLPETTAGQLFASLYGILSGYVYIATSSVLIAPILHRVFHKFYLDE